MAEASNAPSRPAGLLVRASELSSIGTLMAIVAMALGGYSKLDTIDDRSRTNCRAINTTLLLAVTRTPLVRRPGETASDFATRKETLSGFITETQRNLSNC
jgi:hypothetical protein